MKKENYETPVLFELELVSEQTVLSSSFAEYPEWSDEKEFV